MKEITPFFIERGLMRRWQKYKIENKKLKGEKKNSRKQKLKTLLFNSTAVRAIARSLPAAEEEEQKQMSWERATAAVGWQRLRTRREAQKGHGHLPPPSTATATTAATLSSSTTTAATTTTTTPPLLPFHLLLLTFLPSRPKQTPTSAAAGSSAAAGLCCCCCCCCFC